MNLKYMKFIINKNKNIYNKTMSLKFFLYLKIYI